MNYTQFIEQLRGVALSNVWVKEFHSGDIYDYLNSGEHQYANVVLTVDNVTMEGDLCNVSASLFYTDRLLSDSSNAVSIQTMGMNVLRDIAGRLESTTQVQITSQVFNPFTESFTDLCAGVYMTCTINYPAESDCSDEFEVKSLTITNNGIYDVIGYDNAIISVITPTQIKSVNYTQNGSYEVTPDAGLDLSKVNIEVECDVVEPKTWVEVTSAWITAMVQRVINS